MPFGNEIADIVFSRGMFWDNWGFACERIVHMLDHEKIASEVYRVLKPNGLYIGDESFELAEFAKQNFEKPIMMSIDTLLFREIDSVK